ncbi:MAG: ACP S-malonyltransferase [Planctomycetota bacterium]|nr:MAG: ACP S-malonyltransferase [Planctomycetota bacterium]
METAALTAEQLRASLPRTAFAFRGYNVTNLGRTPELLAHPSYRPVVRHALQEASEVCSEAFGKRVDLVARVRRRRETTLQTYGEALALVMGAELAQLRLLREFFDIDFGDSPLCCGYSLGEITALVAGEVFDLSGALTVLLAMSRDAAALARDVTLGVVFSRGPGLDMVELEKLCQRITQQGRGTIAISSVLSPNSCLVLGQRKTVAALKQQLHDVLGPTAQLRENPDRWPPIHTPIVRQRQIPDRAAVLLERIHCSLQPPKVPVVSLVTGTRAYTETNARALARDWIDHRQQLWPVVCELLRGPIDVVVHVGPEPNIIPATFKRLSMNVASQLNENSWSAWGLRTVSHITRNRPWLRAMLSDETSLLRAPFVQHVVLEDWLLANAPEA